MSELRKIINASVEKSYADEIAVLRRTGFSTKMISRVLSIPESDVIRLARRE